MQRAFGWRVGRFLSVGARSVYPAVGTVARQTVAPRAVLVGNAAQTLHPIGAQGFNLGLRDALTLAELVETRGGDPGDPGLLADHAQRREEDRGRTLAMSRSEEHTSELQSLMRTPDDVFCLKKKKNR